MGTVYPLIGCAHLLVAFVIGSVPPNMLTTVFNTQYVKPGSSAEEKCQASGDPNPKYIWKKDGNVVSSDAQYEINPTTGVIKIKSVTSVRGEGTYQCFAQNSLGTAPSGLWEVRVASLTGCDKKKTNNPMVKEYLHYNNMPCEHQPSIMSASSLDQLVETGDNTAFSTSAEDKRRIVLYADGRSTVDPLSAVMQDLWNSDTSRLHDSDYTISSTGSRLFTYLNETTLNKPTYQGFLRLLDNYNRVVGQAEELTTAELAEIDDFINTILATSVMSKTFTFLKSNGYIPDSNFKFRDTLMELWFNLYSRSRRGRMDSSGFEHIMVGELKGTSSVIGFHSWIQFYIEEQNGNLHYKKLITRKEPGMIAIAFSWHGHRKNKSTFFLGTSPEFDIAVYTICSLVHPNSKCTFMLENQSVFLQTWDIAHKSGYQVGSAYPLI